MSQDVISKIMNKIYSCRRDGRKTRQGVYESMSGEDLGRVESGPSQVWACMVGKWQVAAMHATTKLKPEKNLENGFVCLVNPSIG